jgi:hypothetical protein
VSGIGGTVWDEPGRSRFRGDRFVGGPIDNRIEYVDNVPLDELRKALA